MSLILYNENFKDIILSAFGEEPVDITLSYLRDIFKPICKQLDSFNHIQYFNNWISSNIDKSLYEDLINKITDDIDNNRMLCILYLLYNINIIYQENIETYRIDTLLLPWDIKYGIKKNKQLSSIFNFKYNNDILFDDIKLQMTIVINNEFHNDKYNKEFTCGLLLFNLKFKSKYIIKLNDTIFTTDYFYNPIKNLYKFPENNLLMSKLNINIHDLYKKPTIPQYEYTKCIFNNPDNNSYYGITLRGKLFSFNTTLFIRGLCTGALWNDISYDEINKDLIQYYSTDKNRNRIDLKITFTM
jgi:hypothetical protein